VFCTRFGPSYLGHDAIVGESRVLHLLVAQVLPEHALPAHELQPRVAAQIVLLGPAQVLDRGGEALALLVHELPHELDLVVDAVGRGALAQHVVAEAEALRFHHVDDAVVRGNVA